MKLWRTTLHDTGANLTEHAHIRGKGFQPVNKQFRQAGSRSHEKISPDDSRVALRIFPKTPRLEA
jgi:hypothetical protein